MRLVGIRILRTLRDNLLMDAVRDYFLLKTFLLDSVIEDILDGFLSRQRLCMKTARLILRRAPIYCSLLSLTTSIIFHSEYDRIREEEEQRPDSSSNSTMKLTLKIDSES